MRYAMTGRRQYQHEHFLHPIADVSVRVGFDTVRGRVTDFTVQFECWIEGRWHPAVRYDTAHGRAHRDTVDWDGRVVVKAWLPVETTYDDALAEAILDLTKDAAYHRRAFEERRSK